MFSLRFILTPENRAVLAAAHYRWPEGHVTQRGKLYMDDVKAHLGGTGLYGTARAAAEVLLILINEGKHRMSNFWLST